MGPVEQGRNFDVILFLSFVLALNQLRFRRSETDNRQTLHCTPHAKLPTLCFIDTFRIFRDANDHPRLTISNTLGDSLTNLYIWTGGSAWLLGMTPGHADLGSEIDREILLGMHKEPERPEGGGLDRGLFWREVSYTRAITSYGIRDQLSEGCSVPVFNR